MAGSKSEVVFGLRNRGLTPEIDVDIPTMSNDDFHAIIIILF